MNFKKDAIFNTLGNFIYLGALWLMTVLIVRLADYESAGLLAVAMTSANIYISLASYSIRFKYAADIHDEYTDNQYIGTRVLTIVSSVFLCLLISVGTGYDATSVLAIMLFYIYKSFEMASDILFGTLQRHGKLYLCGYSMTAKSVVSLIVFATALYFTKSLPLALVLIDIVALCTFCFYDYPQAKKVSNVVLHLTKKDYKISLKLLQICFPLFIMGLCYNFVPSIPRLVFERIYSTEELGYYASIATITALISTAIGCVLLPLMPKFSLYYAKKEKRSLIKITVQCIYITALIGVAACIGVFFFGEGILELLFGKEILPYSYLFIGVLISTTLTALISCFNNFFIATNEVKKLMYCSIFASVLCLVLSIPLCNLFYMSGIIYCLIIAQGVELILLGILVIKIIKKLI